MSENQFSNVFIKCVGRFLHLRSFLYKTWCLRIRRDLRILVLHKYGTQMRTFPSLFGKLLVLFLLYTFCSRVLASNKVAILTFNRALIKTMKWLWSTSSTLLRLLPGTPFCLPIGATFLRICNYTRG